MEVIDQSGNSWFGGFSVIVESVPDPPVIGGLPPLAYIELGENATYALSISDPILKLLRFIQVNHGLLSRMGS